MPGVMTGTILAVDNQGLVVDVGLKRDGIVSKKDIERLGVNPDHSSQGQEIDVIIIRMEDDDGNLVLSVSQAQQSEDWKKAEALMTAEEVREGIVTDVNKGGLIVPFGNLRGFVPASHFRRADHARCRCIAGRLPGEPGILRGDRGGRLSRGRRRLAVQLPRARATRSRLRVGGAPLLDRLHRPPGAGL